MSYKKSLNILGIDSLHSRRSQLCLNFSLKCIKNEKTRDIFPENRKNHTMNTRKPKIFTETNAKSQRLKKSAVPQMQMMLNQFKQENT